MRRVDVELLVGLFIIAGILSLGYLSIRLAKLEVVGGQGYELIADFASSGGLKVGAQVEIAGVEVGRVKNLSLEDYRARVIISLRRGVEIQEDAIASIKTKGLLGEKYLDILPGGSDVILGPKEKIRETNPPIDLEELISKFVFGKVE
jgi:phospholipid/cholesterol/gamma-HCH transport system substrate-binding protein